MESFYFFLTLHLPGCKMYIDWLGVPCIATSYSDLNALKTIGSRRQSFNFYPTESTENATVAGSDCAIRLHHHRHRHRHHHRHHHHRHYHHHRHRHRHHQTVLLDSCTYYGIHYFGDSTFIYLSSCNMH